MTMCAVVGCKSTNDKRRLIKQPDNFEVEVNFNRFPRDEKLRKEWLYRCGRNRNEDCKAKRLYVCIKHFTPKDFVRNLRLERLNSYPKSNRIVKIDAVPSLFLPASVVIPPEPEIIKEIPKSPKKKSIEQSSLKSPNIDLQTIQLEFIDHVVMAYLNRCRSRAGNTNVGMPNYILRLKAQEAAVLLGSQHLERYDWIYNLKEKVAENDAKGVVLTSIPESLSIADIINDEWPKFAEENGLDISDDCNSEEPVSVAEEEFLKQTENETLFEYDQRKNIEYSMQIENVTSINFDDDQAQSKDTAADCSRSINSIVEKLYDVTQSQTSQNQNVVSKKSQESDSQDNFFRHVLAVFLKRYNASWPQADIPETVFNAKIREAAKILGLKIKYTSVWLCEFKQSISYNSKTILTDSNQSLDISDIIKEEQQKFYLAKEIKLENDIIISETNIMGKSAHNNVECCDSIQTYEEARDCLSLLNNYALELRDCSALSLINQVDSFLRSEDCEE